MKREYLGARPHPRAFRYDISRQSSVASDYYYRTVSNRAMQGQILSSGTGRMMSERSSENFASLVRANCVYVT